MVFGLTTIGTNGFTVVLESGNHWTQWFFNGFQYKLIIGSTIRRGLQLGKLEIALFLLPDPI